MCLFFEKKYDVLVFGMPQFFHYGDGMGTNPIMMMRALSAQVIRHKRIMSDNCVIICASTCNGNFNENLWPYTKEMYEMFQTESMNVLPTLRIVMVSYLQPTKNTLDVTVMAMPSIHSMVLV